MNGAKTRSWDQERPLLPTQNMDDSSSLIRTTEQPKISFHERLKEWTIADWLRLFTLLGLITGIIVVVGVFHSRLGTWLGDFLTWVKVHQFVGAISLAVIYVIATILFVPGLILTLGGGFAFELWVGIVTISIGSTIGACCAFLLGRYLARDWISKKISNFPTFVAIDGAIADRGALIVFLLRLSPVIPFNILNYGLGLTKVPFWTYFPVSWIGMLPGTVLYVYIGHGLQNIADVVSGGTKKSASTQIFLYVGLAITFYLVFVVSIIAKTAISRALFLEKLKKIQKEEPSIDDAVIEFVKRLDPTPADIFDDPSSFLSSPRRLLIKGELDVVDGSSSLVQSRYVFLFSDVLAITVNENKKQEEQQKTGVVRHVKRFFLGKASEEETYWLRSLVTLPISVGEVTHSSSPFAFKLQALNASFIFIAKDRVDRMAWVEAIQSTATRHALNV